MFQFINYLLEVAERSVYFFAQDINFRIDYFNMSSVK